MLRIPFLKIKLNTKITLKYNFFTLKKISDLLILQIKKNFNIKTIIIKQFRSIFISFILTFSILNININEEIIQNFYLIIGPFFHIISTFLKDILNYIPRSNSIAYCSPLDQNNYEDLLEKRKLKIQQFMENTALRKYKLKASWNRIKMDEQMVNELNEVLGENAPPEPVVFIKGFKAFLERLEMREHDKFQHFKIIVGNDGEMT